MKTQFVYLNIQYIRKSRVEAIAELLLQPKADPTINAKESINCISVSDGSNVVGLM